jgi:hypothetical protein
LSLEPKQKIASCQEISKGPTLFGWGGTGAEKEGSEPYVIVNQNEFFRVPIQFIVATKLWYVG